VEMHSREETEKVISVLIENEEIKSALMKEESHLAIETVTKGNQRGAGYIANSTELCLTNTEQQCIQPINIII
jgi:hypothetical protein